MSTISECVVCLDPLTERIKVLQCSHQFHIDCIDRWLRVNNRCPTCRVPTGAPPRLTGNAFYEEDEPDDDDEVSISSAQTNDEADSIEYIVHDSMDDLDFSSIFSDEEPDDDYDDLLYDANIENEPEDVLVPSDEEADSDDGLFSVEEDDANILEELEFMEGDDQNDLDDFLTDNDDAFDETAVDLYELDYDVMG
ncbi:RING finger protein 150-like [Malaya genurostris]|uniref:RING finger protein 150-like n=1 Tax=Malaya genurostris TaxID=325434 RepID=UPI0026F3849B|nr:RING finger protein 150-like [Malaya genurostris]